MSPPAFNILQPYTLEVRRAGPLAKAFSVVCFDGVETLGQPSRFVIRLTHPQHDLPHASFLAMPATLSICYRNRSSIEVKAI